MLCFDGPDHDEGFSKLVGNIGDCRLDAGGGDNLGAECDADRAELFWSSIGADAVRANVDPGSDDGDGWNDAVATRVFPDETGRSVMMERLPDGTPAYKPYTWPSNNRRLMPLATRWWATL
jgi:hypothetical protein